jgi:hypothetical protein
MDDSDVWPALMQTDGAVVAGPVYGREDVLIVDCNLSARAAS